MNYLPNSGAVVRLAAPQDTVRVSVGFPIGALDLGKVDGFEVIAAKTVNRATAPAGWFDRAATDDEVLAAFHGGAL